MKPVCRPVVIGRELPVALCLGGCGLRPAELLTPSENDPPGLCDRCQETTCDCGDCMDFGLYEGGGS